MTASLLNLAVMLSVRKGITMTDLSRVTNRTHPESINGHRIMASIRLWHESAGSLPDAHMVIAEDTRPEGMPLYIVWEVAREGGQWVANNGHYQLTYTRAIQIMTEKALDKTEL